VNHAPLRHINFKNESKCAPYKAMGLLPCTGQAGSLPVLGKGGWEASPRMGKSELGNIPEEWGIGNRS